MSRTPAVPVVAVVEGVLRSVGAELDEPYRTRDGDGMHVFLRPDTDFAKALPVILHSAAEELAVCNGNGDGRERVRLRMAVHIGSVGIGPAGLTGDAVIALTRLVDAPALREAVKADLDADVVALVSDLLYTNTVGRGYPGLRASDFRRVRATVKQFDQDAWLWSPPLAAHQFSDKPE